MMTKFLSTYSLPDIPDMRVARPQMDLHISRSSDGYRSGGPGSIPGTTRKKSSWSGTGSTHPREYN
jgi:hypothetical protein